MFDFLRRCQLGIARSTLDKLIEQSKVSPWRPPEGRCACAPAPAALRAERAASGWRAGALPGVRAGRAAGRWLPVAWGGRQSGREPSVEKAVGFFYRTVWASPAETPCTAMPMTLLRNDRYLSV